MATPSPSCPPFLVLLPPVTGSVGGAPKRSSRDSAAMPPGGLGISKESIRSEALGAGGGAPSKASRALLSTPLGRPAADLQSGVPWAVGPGPGRGGPGLVPALCCDASSFIDSECVGDDGEEEAAACGGAGAPSPSRYTRSSYNPQARAYIGHISTPGPQITSSVMPEISHANLGCMCVGVRKLKSCIEAACLEGKRVQGVLTQT